MLKGPKDEGLALRKKCEEISRHLSSRGKAGVGKKASNSSDRSTRCSTYSGSRAQLSLEQIDALLGIDLVDSVSVSDLSASKFWWVTEKQPLPNFDKSKADVTVSSLPSCSTTFDDIALFIYKHGFRDLLYEDALRGQSSVTSSAIARRRKSQEELLKSGVLRTLARLLKQIHDINFYRSPENKIANALTISIEKRRIDRDGLSADWEFYAANYHPKFPLKEKTIYVQISQELTRGLHKQPILLTSNFKKPAPRSSVSSAKKKPGIADRRKPIPTSKKLSSNSEPNKSKTAKCNVATKAKTRKRRLRVKTKNCILPLTIPGFTANLAIEVENEIERRPSAAYSKLSSSEVDGEIRNKGHGIEIAREWPSTTSQSQMTTFGPGLRLDKAGRGHGASAQLKRYKLKLRNSAGDLSSCMMTGFREYFPKNEPNEALSTLARIEEVFPIPDKEEHFQRRAELQVEIERLKILRW